MGEILVRPVAEQDEQEWRRLFRGYRDFYEQAHDESIIDTVWGWLMDDDHPVRGLVAARPSGLVGIAHFRAFPRPIIGGTGFFLDDLFTDSAARRSGTGTKLLRELARIAADEGATLVRWITAEDNAAARSVYDREAKLTAWATYDMPPTRPGGDGS